MPFVITVLEVLGATVAAVGAVSLLAGALAQMLARFRPYP